MRLIANIILAFCLIHPPSEAGLSPPYFGHWFDLHITIRPVELPEGVSAQIVITEKEFEYLVIGNETSIDLYLAAPDSSRTQNFEFPGIEQLPAKILPYKVVNGNAYRWQGEWTQKDIIFTEKRNSLWLWASGKSIWCESGSVLWLEPDNPDWGDRPEDVEIPQPQDVLLPIIYGTEIIHLPLTISYTLNPSYSNPARAHDGRHNEIFLISLVVAALIVLVLIFAILTALYVLVVRVVCKKFNLGAWKKTP